MSLAITQHHKLISAQHARSIINQKASSFATFSTNCRCFEKNSCDIVITTSSYIKEDLLLGHNITLI